MQQSRRDAIFALAGRRIDAWDAATQAFPLSSVPVVRQRLAALLRAEGAGILCCSAACGADLIALEEAGRLGIRRRVVLPFAPGLFRDGSVTDRPGNWGPVFDRVVAEVAAAGDLLILNSETGDAAYAAATRAIVAQALEAAGAASKADILAQIGVVVWEGQGRTGSDATLDFHDRAKDAGFEIREVLTSVP